MILKIRSWEKALLYGFVVWLIVFAVSIAIYPIHDSNRPLFEAIMPVAITVCTVIFSILYFKIVEIDFLREGITLGILWLAENIIFDLMLFMEGPMKMTITEYMADIGVTYFIIPAITIGYGYTLEKRGELNES